MKKLALLTFMSFAMFAIVYTAIDSFNDSKTVIIPKSEMSQVEPNKNVELAKWMFERQANLKTGEINPEAIQAVYNQIASMNGVKSSMNLNWKFLGPSNIGGKVRAILIDKNNTDIIYAGGSSGGLWKSTTGGTSWKKVDYKGDEETGNIPNLFVNSLCQASNGDIYFGTGDYFSNPYGSTDLTFQGAGIWKSTDGKTFNRLKSTWSSSSSKNIFNYVIKLVAHPSDANTVYAATIKGLRVSKDGGETWTNAVKDANGNYIEDVCQSVAISADGKNMIVSFDGLVYVSNNSGSSSSWTLVSGDEDDLLPENSLRTEIAIAPSNKNVMYAQTTNEDQELLNIYRSTDGGKKWSVIGPGGSSSFNPLGTSGYYNNVIAVFPDNAEKIIVGGEQSLWSWSLSQGWNMLTMPIGGATSGMYVHQSQHDIKFNPNKPEVVFCASSGGVHRSVDGGVSWNTLNSNLAISQIVHFSYGNSNKILASSNEGGIVYLNPDKEVTSGLENEAEMLLDTDGGFCAISNIASEVFLISLPYGTLMRSEEYGGNMGGMYNMRISGKLGMENNNKFKHPYFIAGDLWESFYDKNSIETRQMIAPIDYPAGATVKVQSHIKEHYMSVVLDEPLLKGDTIETIDHYQTRLALGFRGSVWLTTQALDFTVEPDWKPIAYLNDEDDDYEMVNVLKWSADGAYIYFSTTRYQEDAISSILYRVGNFNDYREGTDRDADHIDYKLDLAAIAVFEDRIITGFAIDPEAPGNVVITLGNYGNDEYVYYSTSANVAPSITSGTGSFVAKQGNLPKAPCYDAVILWSDSRKVIIGTEVGIFTTMDIMAGTPLWIDENHNGPNYAPVHKLSQQTTFNGWIPEIGLDNGIRNHGYIWAGTYGKGIYRTKAFAGPVSVEEIAENVQNTLSIYPNPVRETTTLNFYLNENSDVNIQVFDIQGKLVRNMNFQNLDQGNNEKIMNFADLRGGMYMIKLSTKSETQTTRFIKR